ncbi:zinc-binding dehydrogenase [Rhodococcus erythropolis]|uniref:zinc-binding dehydrogenase n=1 Tax=Rhodococcus erythropolis TaxID=1833 RepID=UPI002227668A|nr:zinc-binding dehydrogenase [Rhodococcus erythropolis]MCW2295372.1 NADPH:quinone reductase-like Zn-dependent oxidoreductase [Rhodococcus erythropolis]
MKALVINRTEDGTVLDLVDLPQPELSSHAIRIGVEAASVNRADLLQRAGNYGTANSGDEPARVGLDAAGTVTEIGSEVTEFAVGDRVMALAAGGLAQEVVVDAALALPIPASWSFAEGAAALLALLTEHNALKTAGRLDKGESVLIHAATSGVGLTGVQLARHLGAETIIATSRSTEGDDLLRTLGATHTVHVTDGTFSDEVLESTGGSGVDVVIDHVGGPYLAENVDALAVRGRLVGVGRLGGSEGLLDMDALALKRIELIGVTFRTRSPEEKAELVRAVRTDIDLNSDLNDLRPTIHQVMSWSEAEHAQRTMESNNHLGKIVLTID